MTFKIIRIFILLWLVALKFFFLKVVLILSALYVCILMYDIIKHHMLVATFQDRCFQTTPAFFVMVLLGGKSSYEQ